MIYSACHNKSRFKLTQRGFTLIELLIVITIIAILGSIIISTMNVQRHLGATRNAKRKIDTYTISQALYNYLVDHEKLPDDITTAETYICHTNAPDCSGMINLSNFGKYIGTIPTDPNESNPYSSGYTVYLTTDNQYVVNAPHAENKEVISVLR